MRLRLHGRRLTLATIIAAVALATIAISPAAAIRYGDNDGNAHPWVGLMVAQNADGNPLWRCSGTLLSSTVLLTAGHCVEPSEDAAQNPTHVEVWFSAGPIPLAFPDAASWKDQAVRVRKVANPWLYSINQPLAGLPADGDLILSDNASSGGTCFGDSGGPNFIGDSRVIAGVNSFVLNSNCAGLSGAYRIDHAADLEWIGSYLK